MNSNATLGLPDEVLERVEAVVARQVGPRQLFAIEGLDESRRSAFRRAVAHAIGVGGRQHEERRLGEELDAVLVEAVDHLVDGSAAGWPVHGAQVVNGFESHPTQCAPAATRGAMSSRERSRSVPRTIRRGGWVAPLMRSMSRAAACGAHAIRRLGHHRDRRVDERSPRGVVEADQPDVVARTEVARRAAPAARRGRARRCRRTGSRAGGSGRAGAPSQNARRRS